MPKTASGLTDIKEAFARYVGEGDTYSGAYRQAYNAENMSNEAIWVEASRLMSDPKVSLRVMELQEMAQERTLVTIESLTKEYEEARQLALGEGQAAAAATATTGKGKLHGLFEKDNEQAATKITVNPIEELMKQVDGKTRSK
jgi:16S rRNA C1402 (ribose-2'-O) methylase RsmI